MKKGFLRKKSHRHFSVPHIHGQSRGEKRKTRHEEGAWTRDLAQRTPAAGEAAVDRGADGGDEAAAAGGGVNAGEYAAGAAMEADEGAEAEGGGGGREARAPAKTTPRRESASASAPPLSREAAAGLSAAVWRTPTRAHALGTPREPPAPQR